MLLSIFYSGRYARLIWLGTLLFSLNNCAIGQSISMMGRIMDDSGATSVKNAVVMAMRLSDSILVKFTRSDAQGFFRLIKLPIDTYQVVFEHPDFGDRTFIILGTQKDSLLNFNKVSLPIRSRQLAEVTIFGFTSPVYFKGDTLIYAADSFKVKPNAVAEDLLKKLPGIRVDKDGKIFAQGEQVDKVFVDGDEFFGSDPTIATKNLPANSIESVQVYDKKNENAGNGDKETEKIMNLKLKEDAKKGYFGKISGAGDFNKFFEEQAMFNRFNGKLKFSVFNFGSNTLNTQLSWQDINQYGLNNEAQYQYNDDYAILMNSNKGGIPRIFKNGIYFTDQVFKTTKLSFNYTNTNSNLNTLQNVSSQYLLSDTSYQTHKISVTQKHSSSNAANLTLEQKIDSLTKITLTTNFKYEPGTGNYGEINQFISSDNELQRATAIQYSNDSKKYNLRNNVILTHDFKKKNRKLFIRYAYNRDSNHSNGILHSTSNQDTLQTENAINQKKVFETNNEIHLANITYTEPLSKKIKAELSCDYMLSKGVQEKVTSDSAAGGYTLINDSLTNSFTNNLQTAKAGIKLIYETKKKTFYIGTEVKQEEAANRNNETHIKFSQKINSVLPYARFRYTLSDNARLNISYRTSSQQPDLNQLQPVNDNSDPNSIRAGNPDLLPSYSHSFNLVYNFFKPVRGNSMWSSLRFTTVQNAISNSIDYDNAGRSITKPINVNGNYNASFNFNYSCRLFDGMLEAGPDVSSSLNNYSTLINGERSYTRSAMAKAGLYTTIHADSGAIEINLYGNYGNNFSKATISNISNRIFITGNYEVSVSYDMTKTWNIASNLNYTYQNQQTNASNLEYYIWNTSINKKIFKNESLILSMEAYDILNQNMNADQAITDNVVTYSKSNTVGRYFLLKAVYKFSNNKAKKNEE